MGYCETHDLEFNMTCPACDYELNYMNRTYLLDAFRAGVRGNTLTVHTDHLTPAILADKHLNMSLLGMTV